MGIAEDIDKSGRCDSVRVKLVEMDPKFQNREMQKIGVMPDKSIPSKIVQIMSHQYQNK